MRISPVVTLIASIAIGAVALIAARGWLKPSQADATSIPQTAEESVAPQTMPVVVAKRAIPRGAAIDETRLEIVQWPVDDVPEGTFRTVSAIGSSDFAIRRALMPIEPGQAILDAALTDVGVRPSLAARLEPGFRAYTLRMDDVTGVGGFVLPGDRIDILFTWEQIAQARAKNITTEVLLQDIEVLAVDLNDDMAAEKPDTFKTATVAVSVSDAQQLSLAAEVGTLSFVLRGIDDREVGEFSRKRLVSNAPLSEGGPAPVSRPHPNPTGSSSANVSVLSGDEVLAFKVPKE